MVSDVTTTTFQGRGVGSPVGSDSGTSHSTRGSIQSSCGAVPGAEAPGGGGLPRPPETAGQAEDRPVTAPPEDALEAP